MLFKNSFNMALNLKENKTWEDRYGNVYPNAYGVIDVCNGSKKPNVKSQVFVFEIYKDKTYRDAKKHPSYQESYTVTGRDWETYFSVRAINADDNQYKKAYEYLLALEHNVGTDEEPVMELVWKDWESDE